MRKTLIILLQLFNACACGLTILNNSTRWSTGVWCGFRGRPPAWFDSNNVGITEMGLELWARQANRSVIPPSPIFYSWTTSMVTSR